MLLAIIADGVRWLMWSKTKDAEKNRNMPESIYELLMGMMRESIRSELSAIELKPITQAEVDSSRNVNEKDILIALNRIESKLNNQAGIYLDGDTLVGGILGRVDSGLGNNAQNARRLAMG